MSRRKEKIVMFPFMAQGHIIPFLALAHQLEQTKKYTITFVNTSLNIQKLRPSIPANSSIHLLEIPFDGSGYGLPPGTENTDSIPYHLIGNLFHASLSLKPSFRKLISDLVKEQNGHPPLCIITGIFYGWCAEIAHEFGAFHAIFCGGGAFGFACYTSLWFNLPHQNKNSDEFTIPDFPEASKIHVTQLAENLRVANGSDHFSLFLQHVLPEWRNADGILMNTVEELDGVGLEYFRRKIGKPVWPIGPVLLSNRCQDQAGITPELCRNWLDTKPANSVLYISFGSQNVISAPQMMELAKALEASGKNFIWVVRPPTGFDINMEFKATEWLPEGFVERMKDSERGLLVHKWAPQVEILSHKSVSAFLSHCGWNSVLESLSQGVPLIGWPMAAEQFYNVMLLEEQIGVCVEVARGKSCEVRHEEIVKKIMLVMDETEKGKEMRKKASDIRDMVMDAVQYEKDLKGSSVKAMDEFLNAAFLRQEETISQVHQAWRFAAVAALVESTWGDAHSMGRILEEVGNGVVYYASMDILLAYPPHRDYSDRSHGHAPWAYIGVDHNLPDRYCSVRGHAPWVYTGIDHNSPDLLLLVPSKVCLLRLLDLRLHEFGAFHAIFSGCGAFGFACYYSLWLNLPHQNKNSDEFTLPDFPEASTIHITQLSENLKEADCRDLFSVFLQNVLPECTNADGILLNTVEELDKVGLEYFQRKIGKPVWPIGLVLLSNRSQDQAGITSELCRNWLDKKTVNSVLYISFGSQNVISAPQMMELAKTLEASGKNFIWVARPPIGFDINMEFKATEWLPEGFEERMKDSERGFYHGVPLIGWPMAAEQFYNVMLLEEQIGVCVEVARGKSCVVRHEGIVKKIMLVMDETEKGKEMRDVVMDAVQYEKDLKGSSVKAMDEFLDAALMIQEGTKRETDCEV
ncbi:unnamed protein product [Dovyalis caffra]|uniref:anthocyanidin 3-O-glucosyltransferase n=1 Tax=Dovyalis caffra TaxID=77055 RepID=A0AAV1RRI6_9ROSI|nr:unnamed protein product [Dovyalis caffra]